MLFTLLNYILALLFIYKFPSLVHFIVKCLTGSFLSALKSVALKMVSLVICLFIAMSFLKREDTKKFFKENIIGAYKATDILDNYQQDSEEIEALEEEILRKYGIRVYTNVDYSKVYHDGSLRVSTTAGKKDVILFMKELDRALDMYSNEAFLSIPKEIYLVDEILHEGRECAGVYTRFAILYDVDCLNSIPEVIHHELFHAVSEQMGADRYFRFIREKESCRETSDYACTSNVEHLAEAWSLSLTANLGNRHTRILAELYPRLLKGDRDREPMSNNVLLTYMSVFKDVASEDFAVLMDKAGEKITGLVDEYLSRVAIKK